jgi:hypothetical protein
MPQRRIPSPQAARSSLSARAPKSLQGQDWTLFDFQNYAAAGQNVLTYFQNPVGQNGRSLEDTNMRAAGSLPAPQKFLVQSVQLMVIPGVDPVTAQNTATTDLVAPNFANDVWAILSEGSLKFSIMSKDYIEEGPLLRFPPDARLSTDISIGAQMKQAVAADEVTAVYGDYASGIGKPWYFRDKVFIEETENFQVTLNWPNGVVALPSGTQARVGVFLRGVLYRAVQ